MAERGTRLSETWIPTDKDIEFAHDLGMTDTQIAFEADKFRDYWISLPGQKATKVNWHSTWRNWIRKDYQRAAESTRKAVQRSANGSTNGTYSPDALKVIAQHVRRPWYQRGHYGRDVLEQCVKEELITVEQMEAAL